MTTIEVLFVAAGLFALCWAIMSPSAGPGQRAAAGTFGILSLLIAAFLGAGREDQDRDWPRRDW